MNTIRVSLFLLNLSKSIALSSRCLFLKFALKNSGKTKKKMNNEIFPILQKLANMGSYPEAEYHLCLLYLNKQGISEGETVPNFEYAEQFNIWLQQSAEKGHAKAKELCDKITDS